MTTAEVKQIDPNGLQHVADLDQGFIGNASVAESIAVEERIQNVAVAAGHIGAKNGLEFSQAA